MNYIERNRDFKGVWIPKEIWLNENLTMLEKVILTEIDSLDNEEHCVAGNEYLAQFCQCSEWKVSTAIKKLQDLGYLEVVSFDGRHRRLKSCVWKIQTQTLENPKADFGKPKAININNNIDNNIFINNGETSSPTDISETSPIESIEEEKTPVITAPPTPPPVEKKKRQSLKDQLTEYVNSTQFTAETKDVLFKWIFSIGLPKNVRLEQLRDMLKKIWTECNEDETLVRESIEKSYLSNWFGFYPTKVTKPSTQPKTSQNPVATKSNSKQTEVKQPKQVGCFTVY